MILKDDVDYVEELSFEELESDVKVYNQENELVLTYAVRRMVACIPETKGLAAY